MKEEEEEQEEEEAADETGQDFQLIVSELTIWPIGSLDVFAVNETYSKVKMLSPQPFDLRQVQTMSSPTSDRCWNI